MGDFIIKTHDFETYINQLKVFSEQNLTDVELRKVDISGGFLGLGDHKVNGYELNSLTTQIQDNLIYLNSSNIKCLKEFRQVYNALAALDKDYIQAIIIAFKAAEKANNEIKVAQGDITKTIELQKKTINILKQFKKKIESYKHLEEIDETWVKCKTFEMDIIASKNAMNAHEEQIDSLKNSLHEMQKHIDERSQIISKKLMITYLLAGGSIGIAIIEFFLLMMRIK